MRLSYPGRGPFAIAGKRLSSLNTPLRVLAVCTANAARSQIAEGLVRLRGRRRIEPEGVVAAPARRAHPGAFQGLRMHAVPTSGPRPRGTGVFSGHARDAVITVCHQVRCGCPLLPGTTPSAHRGCWIPPGPAGRGWAGAFDDGFRTLSRRIAPVLALPLGDLEPPAPGEAFAGVGRSPSRGRERPPDSRSRLPAGLVSAALARSGGWARQ